MELFVKNNTMIIFLLILLLGTFFILKKIKVNIDFSISGLDYYFCIHISCFKFCKTFYKEDVLKILYKRKKKIKEKMKDCVDNWMLLEAFKIEKIILNSKLGVGDVFLTSLLIPIVSSISCIFFQKNFPQASKSVFIQPVWNEIHLSIKGSIYSYVRLKDIGYTFFYSWLVSKSKNKKLKNN